MPAVQGQKYVFDPVLMKEMGAIIESLKVNTSCTTPADRFKDVRNVSKRPIRDFTSRT
jgi:hypothetical protein